jgi:glyoxylate reductase
MKILVTSRLPKAVMELIEKEHHVEANDEARPMNRDRLLQCIGDKDGLLSTITDRIDAELLTQAPLVKMIANYGVGYNNIDLEEATARGILVSNTPDVLTDATADIAFALILATARRVIEGDHRVREGTFRHWVPFHFLGSEVTGKTLGIIGLGRIGEAVARRAKGFAMPVIYYNRHRKDRLFEEALGVTYRALEDLLLEADFISLHVPLTGRTHHLIGPKEIAQMNESAFLINTSRGSVVDEEALVRALKKREIAGAGLDVYEKEPELAPGLKELKNVVLLPHVGSATFETRTNMAHVAVQNLLAGLAGTLPPNCINPAVYTSKKTPAS